MKKFNTEIYSSVLTAHSYIVWLNTSSLNLFILTLLVLTMLKYTPPPQKKKSNSTLPFDFALWGAVFLWDGERGPQQESRSYKQESKVHTDVDQASVQDVVERVVVFWMSAWSALGWFKRAVLHGSCGEAKKKKKKSVQHWLNMDQSMGESDSVHQK